MKIIFSQVFNDMKEPVKKKRIVIPDFKIISVYLILSFLALVRESIL
ncbi:MAG: hypothetical protein IPN67_17880 [Bacteroidales bacterium]|nr:hypothetical protein [Bacteroidales bacterium]